MYDGTSTSIAAEIQDGSNDGIRITYAFFAVFNSKLYFQGCPSGTCSSSTGRELWSFDGSSATSVAGTSNMDPVRHAPIGTHILP